mgnify:CR=1 FL=1
MREDDATAVASPRTLNANVRVTLVFVFMLSASMSLYSTTTLASYIFLVTGSNAKVGFATGIQGVTNLALAIPASILGDRARRTSVLRGAAGLGLGAPELPQPLLRPGLDRAHQPARAAARRRGAAAGADVSDDGARATGTAGAAGAAGVSANY